MKAAERQKDHQRLLNNLRLIQKKLFYFRAFGTARHFKAYMDSTNEGTLVQIQL